MQYLLGGFYQHPSIWIVLDQVLWGLLYCAVLLLLCCSSPGRLPPQVVSAELASLGQSHSSLQATAAGLRQELNNTQNLVRQL